MRTYLRKDVELQPGRVSLTLEGKPVRVKHPLNTRCWRCGKLLADAKVAVVVTERYQPRARRRWPFTFMEEPKPKHYKIRLYHGRCVPPNVFNAAAGSRPAPGRSRVAPVGVGPVPASAAQAGAGGTVMAKGDA